MKKQLSDICQKYFGVVKSHPKQALYVVLGAVAVNFTFKQIHSLYERNKIDLLAKKKYQIILEEIQEFYDNYLKDFVIDQKLKEEILRSNIQGLKKLEYDGRATVEQILLVFIERSIKYGVPNKWLADVCFNEALNLAKQQDQLIAENREILYTQGNELFGIPVTFKEMFIVKGYDCTCGIASRLFKKATFDGYQAYAFKKAGAIIFAKTNNPQMGYAFETNNYIYGRALNPYNKNYITGGSTGGEGAMISSRCSILGMGSDIGGSIRIPASFNGIYGLKPCTKRICVKGQIKIHKITEGFRNLVVSNGPLAQSVDDIATSMKVLLDTQTYDQAPVVTKDTHFYPIPFKMDEYKDDKIKLKIGYFKEINLVPTSAATKRAIQIAIESLQKLGHELVEIDIEKILVEAGQLAAIFALADNFRSTPEIIKHERMIPEYNQLLLAPKIPKFIIKIAAKLFKHIGFNRDVIMMNAVKKEMSAYDFLVKSGEQGQVQADLAQYWQNLGIDAIICPLTAGVALKHGQTQKAYSTLIYSMPWNILDYSCGIVPVTTVQQDECHFNVPHNSLLKDSTIKVYEEAMKDAHGLPVSIQIITQPFKEELCLNVMKQLQDSINFDSPPSLN